MLDKLLSATWLKEEEILLQITTESDKWNAAMTMVKQEFESDYKLYRSTKRTKAKDKIWDWTVFSTHSALMARSYITRPESYFESSDIWDDLYIKNLNNALEEDFNSDDMEIVKYWRDFFKYLFWVGITIRNWWDWNTKKSTFQYIDPRNATFDPDWDYPLWRYWYFWFNRDIYKDELENWGLWNDELSVTDRNENAYNQDPKISDQINAGINTQYSNESDFNPIYKIYYHETTFTWPKWSQLAIVITWNTIGVILGVILLKTKTCAFSYWRPDGTPTWMRVTAITWDVQRIKAEFSNLRLDKSKAELYPMYLRNKRLIPNATDLEFGFNKIIDVNPLEWENLNNALAPMQKDFRADNSFLIEQSLDSTVESAISIGKIQKWWSPERREWVGTNNLIAEATDVNLALNAKIEAWWEKQLLRLYLNWLRENLTNWDKKRVNVMTAYGLVPRDLTKKDFALWDNISIKIITVIEKEKKDNKLRLAYWTAIWLVQNLNLTESAKKFLYRDYFETIWLDVDKAERIVDYTPDEIEAIINVWLLNLWEFIKVKENYDPMTHLSAVKAARPWENVDLYKYLLRGLYKIKWIEAEQKQQALMSSQNNASVENNMAAQSMWNIANENREILQQK